MRLVTAFVVLASMTLAAQQTFIPTDLGTAPLTQDATSGGNNTLSYGVNVAGVFDDHAVNAIAGGTQANSTASVQPQISLAVKRGHLNSAISYSPGFTYSSDSASYGNSAQILGADVQYFLTQHLSLHLRNAFSRTSNAYDSFTANTELPNLGVLNRPNDSAIRGNFRNTSEASQGDLIYQIGRHTSVGLGGAFTKVSDDPVVSRGSISGLSLDSQVWSTHAFYSHQWTARYSGGIQYSAQDFFSVSPVGRFSSLSHQLLGFLNVAFTPHVQFSIFAGAQYTHRDDRFLEVPVQLPSHSSQPSLAAGSSLNWQGEHSGISASFFQQVNDSGFNGAGSALVRTTDFEVQRRITNRLKLNVFGNYIANQRLNAQDTVALADWASAGIRLSRVMTPRLSVGVSGVRQQFMGNSPSFTRLPSQRSYDLISVSLSYSLQAPIGR